MSKAKDFKEAFKSFDNEEEISWKDVLNYDPLSWSEVDSIFAELTIEGEDRVFGIPEFAIRPPLLKPKDVIKPELKKKLYDDETKKIKSQVWVPKKRLEEKESTEEDWVVVGKDDIKDKIQGI